jgi:hypothetical protein
MIGRSWPALVVLAVGAAGLEAQSQLPVFRASAETVAVNVSVTQGRTLVTGLTARDFRLYDNDVPQEVSAVSLDAVPLDVSIVLMIHGVWGDPDRHRDDVREMVAFLRPIDRVRVLTTRNGVASTPWQPPSELDTSVIHPMLGVQLLADSVLVALFHRAAPDRRHLVVTIAYEADQCSLTPSASLTRSAERSGAVLHWVKLLWSQSFKELEASGLAGPVAPGVQASCRNTRTTDTHLGSPLSEAVRVTGGTVTTAWYQNQAERIGVEPFEQILEDFRRSYVLHYVPQKVERTGWHRLRVETAAKGLTVRARTGYWGTAAAPAGPPVPASR